MSSSTVSFVAGKETTLDTHKLFLEPAVIQAGCAYEGVLTGHLGSAHAGNIIITTPTLERGAVSGVSEIRRIIEDRIGTRDFPGLIIFDLKPGHTTEDINSKTKIVHSFPDLSGVITQLLALK